MRLNLVVAALIGYLQLSQSIPLEADGKYLEKDNDECAQYQYFGAQVLVETLLVYFPIEIKSYFNQNTILNINGGPTININNAPVYINTVVYGSVTSIVTSTLSTLPISNSSVAASSSVMSSKSTAKPVFTASPATAKALTYPAGAILNLSGFNIVPIKTTTTQYKKRQFNPGTSNSASTNVSADASANIYVGSGGLLTSCPTAAIFDLLDGSLFGLNSQFPTIYGQGGPLDNSIFGTPPTLGEHTTGFYVLDSKLYWINPFFVGEEIGFCILNNLLYVIFNGIPIPGCSSALLNVLPGQNCQTSNNTFVPSATTTPAGLSTSQTGPVFVSASQSLATTIQLSSVSFVSGSTSPSPIASTSLPSATTATPSTPNDVLLSSTIATLSFLNSITTSQDLTSSNPSPSLSTGASSGAGNLVDALTLPSGFSSGFISSSSPPSTDTSAETYTSSAPYSTSAATVTETTISPSSSENQITSLTIAATSTSITTSTETETTSVTSTDTSTSATTSIENETTSVTSTDTSTSATTSTESETNSVSLSALSSSIITADTSVSSNIGTSANTTTSSLPTTTSATPVCVSGRPQDESLVDNTNLNNEEVSIGNLQDCARSCKTVAICEYFSWVSDNSGGGLCLTFTTFNDLGDNLDGSLDETGSGFFSAACADAILSSSDVPSSTTSSSTTTFLPTSATGPCEFGVTSSGDPVSVGSTEEFDSSADTISECASKCDQGIIMARKIRPVQPAQCLYFYWDESSGQCDLYTIDISGQLNIITQNGGAGYYSSGCIDSLRALPRP